MPRIPAPVRVLGLSFVALFAWLGLVVDAAAQHLSVSHSVARASEPAHEATVRFLPGTGPGTEVGAFQFVIEYGAWDTSTSPWTYVTLISTTPEQTRASIANGTIECRPVPPSYLHCVALATSPSVALGEGLVRIGFNAGATAGTANLVLRYPTGFYDQSGERINGVTVDGQITVVHNPTLAVADAVVYEGQAGTTVAAFNVNMAPAALHDVSFDLATADGNATAVSDYVARQLQGVVIPAGDTRFRFEVELNGDALFEFDERFTVALSNASGAAVARAAAEGVVVNDDDAPLIYIDDSSVTEGTGGTTDLVFPIRLEEASGRPVYVSAWAQGYSGTATVFTDFEPEYTSFELAPGETEGALRVPVVGDTWPEYDETLRATMSAAAARPDRTEAIGTILDDDVPEISINDAVVSEGDDGSVMARFWVQLSPGSDKPVTFAISTSDGSARAGSDYVARELHEYAIPSFSYGTWVEVEVLGDTRAEPDETFTVQLANVVNAAVADGQATGTILGDEDDPALISEVPGIETESESGFADLWMGFLPALPNARFGGTALAEPKADIVEILADNNPASAYDSLVDGVAWTSFVVPATPADGSGEYLALVTAESDTATRLRLYVGRDFDGDGPELSEERCRRVGDGADKACVVVIRRNPGSSPAAFWVMVQKLAGTPYTRDAVLIESSVVAELPENRALVATGPGHVDADAEFSVRVAWDDPGLLPGGRRVGFLLAYAEPGQIAYYEPVRLTRLGTRVAAHALRPGVPRAVSLAPAAAHNRLYFDVPANATSVTFAMSGSGDASLRAIHQPAPTGPAIANAPASGGLVSATAGTSSETITLAAGQLLPGRWYLKPVNVGATRADVTVTATVDATTARPAFRSGHYYNPARSGHGIFLDTAGDQWFMVWYAYLQDGTPTWYFGQAPAPGASSAQWSTDLLRVVWNGSAASATRVGEAVFTIQPGAADASPKLVYSFNLDGESGWEPLSRLGDDACPSYGGQALDASGHWYSPERSGFGYSAQFLPNTEVHAAYLYDGVGYPRWLYGQRGFDAANPSVDLLQITGFCPLCSVLPLSTTRVGTMTRLLAASSNNDGKPGLSYVSVNAAFAAPLPGTWQQAFPVYLLSERKGCF